MSVIMAIYSSHESYADGCVDGIDSLRAIPNSIRGGGGLKGELGTPPPPWDAGVCFDPCLDVCDNEGVPTSAHTACGGEV